MKNIETTSWLSKIHRANAKGHSTVEMSLLMLPFILLILAVMEFGMYYFHQHSIQFATREGMRLALVGEVLLDEQGDPLTRDESIEQMIRQNASWAMDSFNEGVFRVDAGQISGNNYFDDPASFSNPNGAVNAGNPADYMKVRVQYYHKFITPMIGNLFQTDAGCGEENCVLMEAFGTYRNELFTVS
jgi:Flp pilus assembly protein TadG